MIKVVKIGGNVVHNRELLQKFVMDFAAMPGMKILVHGGGVMASQMQKAMGMTPQMIEGRRVTDEDTLKVVTMVYAGWCNKNIVSKLQAAGCNAIGLTGADGNVIKAHKRKPLYVESIGTDVDYGYVGDVDGTCVNAGFIHNLLVHGMVPVLCAINHDGEGILLNTNADTIASSVAVAMAGCSPLNPKEGTQEDKVELVYCFEKDGVLYDRNDDSSIIQEIDPALFEELKKSGIIAEGMIPKLSNAFKAIESGVAEVKIKHAGNLLNNIGTTLLKLRKLK